MTLRLSALRDTLSLGGYCYGQQLESKSYLMGSLSRKVKLTCGHHTASNSVKASELALILSPAIRIPNPLDRCKLRIAQLASTFIHVVSSHTNICAKMIRNYERFVI